MLHVAIALLLSQYPGKPGDPIQLWISKADPFTDEFEIRLSGVGKAGELSVRASCFLKESGKQEYLLHLRFESETQYSKFEEAGDEIGYLDLRFDDGPIEQYWFVSFRKAIMLGRGPYKDGKVPRNDDDDKLVRRFADHDRLRIDLTPEEGKKAFERIVEDFDISEVNALLLEHLCECANEPNPCVIKQE